MGLSIADAASLVTKGYKVSELKEVGSLIEQNPSEGNNIIELAKKLGFSEFQCAMQLFVKPDDKKSEDQNNQNDETDHNEDDHVDEKNKDSSSDVQGKDDDVDYKKLYEEEKSLRQKLQQKKQSEDTSGKDDKRSDWDIAVQLASDVLN